MLLVEVQAFDGQQAAMGPAAWAAVRLLQQVAQPAGPAGRVQPQPQPQHQDQVDAEQHLEMAWVGLVAVVQEWDVGLAMGQAVAVALAGESLAT
jgi:hypothetical protein